MKKIAMSVAAALGVALTMLAHAAMAETRQISKPRNGEDFLEKYYVFKDSNRKDYSPCDQVDKECGSWQWYWQNVYSNMTASCVAPSGQTCNISKTSSVTNTTTHTVGGKVQVASKSPYGDLLPALQGFYMYGKSRSKTESQTYGMAIKGGYNIYAGYIALEKDLKGVGIVGNWVRDDDSCKMNIFRIRQKCTYVLDEVTYIAHFSGREKRKHRVHLCASKNENEPRVGDMVRNGPCPLPRSI